MFSSPVFLLSSAIATLWGGIFQLLFGKRWTDLVQYWFIAIVAFGVGQLMASAIGLTWPRIGQVHVIEASLVCWATLFIARWLKV